MADWKIDNNAAERALRVVVLGRRTFSLSDPMEEARAPRRFTVSLDGMTPPMGCTEFRDGQVPRDFALLVHAQWEGVTGARHVKSNEAAFQRTGR